MIGIVEIHTDDYEYYIRRDTQLTTLINRFNSQKIITREEAFEILNIDMEVEKMFKRAKDLKVGNIIKLDIGGALFPVQAEVAGVKIQEGNVEVTAKMAYSDETFHFAIDEMVEIV